MLLSEVEGKHLDIGELELPMFEVWGRAVGNLHARFDRLPDHLRRPPVWRESLSLAAVSGDLLAREAESLGEALAVRSEDPGSFGTIHTDVELDNLLWNGEDFGVIDFDEYVTGFRALEIAKALSELDADPLDPRVSAFMSGYQEHHPLPDDALESLPLMTRLWDLGMYLRLRRAFEMPLDEQGGQRLEQLVASLNGWMKRYENRTAARFEMEITGRTARPS